MARLDYRERVKLQFEVEQFLFEEAALPRRPPLPRLAGPAGRGHPLLDADPPHGHPGRQSTASSPSPATWPSSTTTRALLEMRVEEARGRLRLVGGPALALAPLRHQRAHHGRRGDEGHCRCLLPPLPDAVGGPRSTAGSAGGPTGCAAMARPSDWPAATCSSTRPSSGRPT